MLTLKMLTPEIQNSNFQMFKTFCFRHLNFGHSYLFRASDFVLFILLLHNLASIIFNPVGYDETGVNKGTLDTKIVIDATKPVRVPFPTRVTPPTELLESMKLKDYLE